MARQITPTLPAPLACAVRRFQKWRKTRTKPRIPEPLWKLAAGLGKKYGVSQTAKTLHLDYYDLKRRVEAADSEVGQGETPGTFVEVLPAASSPASACVVELDDGRGVKMRIQLKSAGAAELTALGQLFWRQEG